MVFVCQSYPDFSMTISNEREKRISLNPRYPYFKQNYYTAGDFEQFIQNWKVLPSVEKEKEVYPCCDLPTQLNWTRYQNLCLHDYYNTFLYIFEKFKKGCFLQIHDNQLKTFLPYSKQGFRNEWGQYLRIDPRFQTIQRMMKYISEHDHTFPYDEKRINNDLSSWYGNNGLVRFEYPLSENDTGYNMLKDMFECLVRERKLPDIDFFLGKRDHPWLTLDGHEPYDAFFGKRRLISHEYRKYAPILSMNSTDKHADIPIPTWEDWRRVAYQEEGKIFSRDNMTYPSVASFDAIPWASKKATLVFRGASTGRGTTLQNNPRLFFSELSKQNRCDENGIPFLDVGISKWNLRPRKSPESDYLTTLYVDTLDLPTLDYMNPLEQCKYKYILHLPGHTAAYRLSLELYYGSVIFIYPCSNYLWFFKMLKPWEHYIPLEPELSEEDVFAKLEWCRNHDAECQQIAKNAKKFAQQYLSREGILNYLQAVFWKLKDCGVNVQYMEKSILESQKNYIDEYLQRRQEALYNKPVFFLSEIFEDALYDRDPMTLSRVTTNPIFMSYFFNYLFHHRYLVSFLQRCLTTAEFKNSKNSELSLFTFYNSTWIAKKIKSSWKNDELHQLFIGYRTMNELALRLPNFMFTYYAHEDLNREDNQSSMQIFVEYKKCPTLEQMIREKKMNLEELIFMWSQLCLVLEEAQMHSGFIHMDLYPWNILVEEKPTEVIYLQKYKLTTRFNPILIDYGNSHIVHGGRHFYTTTPFYFNRFQDIISIVFSSLDIFLHTSILSSLEIQKCIKIMNFFSGSCMFSKNSFTSISQIKQFIRKQKKFSTMLSSPKTTFQEFRPLLFFQYLHKLQQNPHLVILKQKQKPDYTPYYGPFTHHFNLLSVYQSLLVKETSIPPEDLAIWLRRMWSFFFEEIGKYDVEVDYKFFFVHVQNYMQYYSLLEKQFEQIFKMKIWKISKKLGHESTIQQIALSKDEIQKLTRNTLQQNNLNRCFPKLPLLNTHNCALCDAKCFYQNDQYYQNIDALYNIKQWGFSDVLDDVDLFQYRTYDIQS